MVCMANHSEVTITSASGETLLIATGAEGRAFVGATGTITAGAILLVVKPNGAATEYVADTIDAVTLAANADEAGTGYGFFEEIQVPSHASVALVANAAFAGSVTAIVVGEPY